VPLWDNVEKYGRAGQATDDNIIRSMRCACWINKATDTHSEYVILIALSQQQWLHEGASILSLYLHCLTCLVLFCHVVGQCCCFVTKLLLQEWFWYLLHFEISQKYFLISKFVDHSFSIHSWNTVNLITSSIAQKSISEKCNKMWKIIWTQCVTNKRAGGGEIYTKLILAKYNPNIKWQCRAT
jgi:hypothetical protein